MWECHQQLRILSGSPVQEETESNEEGSLGTKRMDGEDWREQRRPLTKQGGTDPHQ